MLLLIDKKKKYLIILEEQNIQVKWYRQNYILHEEEEKLFLWVPPLDFLVSFSVFSLFFVLFCFFFHSFIFFFFFYAFSFFLARSNPFQTDLNGYSLSHRLFWKTLLWLTLHWFPGTVGLPAMAFSKPSKLCHGHRSQKNVNIRQNSYFWSKHFQGCCQGLHSELGVGKSVWTAQLAVFPQIPGV